MDELDIEGMGMKIQRLSASTFRITSEKGKVIVLDPWLTGDPFWPMDEKDPEKLSKIDIVAITHGHFDHFPGVFEIAKANGEVIVLAVLELAMHLKAQGIKNIRPMGVGGTLSIEGIKFTTVHCVHSSSLIDPEKGVSQWVGPAVGYIIELENGFRIYALGDTGLYGDMKFIGEYYKPDVALVPVSGSGFVMEAEQAFFAVTNLIKPRYVIPFHDFPEPSEASNPEEAMELIQFLPQSRDSIGAARPFIEMMKRNPEFKVCYLKIGESTEFK